MRAYRRGRNARGSRTCFSRSQRRPPLPRRQADRARALRSRRGRSTTTINSTLRLSPWTTRIAGLRRPRRARSRSNCITSLGAEETFPEDDDEAPPADEERGDAEEESSSNGEPQDDTPTPGAPAPAPLEALLDGGRRLFLLDEIYDALPVIAGFSAPELLTHTSVQVTAACDVFSLGAILYFLVSGTAPPTSIYTRQAPALPARSFRPDFPIGLGGVIDRATRAEPGERFGSVAAMREAWVDACSIVEARETARAFPPRARGAVERHIGIAKRVRNPTNQDQVFYAQSANGRFALMIVADGVSTASYGSGDLASEQLRAVAEGRWPELLTAWERDALPSHTEIAASILEEANERLVAYINERFIPFEGNPHEVMGTTCLVAIAHDGVVTLASLGDSRAYVQHGPHFERVTTDHNLWTLSILEGLAADSALALPHGEALARCMGTFYIEDGILHPIPPQPDFFRIPIAPGDQLLLATDGLLDFAGPTTPASEDRVLEALRSETNPALACLELVLLANRGGGGDNVGVGIIQFH